MIPMMIFAPDLRLISPISSKVPLVAPCPVAETRRSSHGGRESSGVSSSKKRIREYIPLDKIFFLEILYVIILCAGIVKTLILSGPFLFTAFYYLFLVLSMLNLIISEILHASA